MTAPVEVLPAGVPEADWLDARRQGIGASEIAAVLGISPWESPFSLFWRKVNDWQVEVTEEMATGTRLEPVIADWWADDADPHENLVIRSAGLFAHPDRPWQLATPDRLLYLQCLDCDGRACDQYSSDWPDTCRTCWGSGTRGAPVGAVECKWVGHSWDGWGEPGTDDIPVHYRAQVLWQADILDVDQVHVAVLGPGGFRAYVVRRDERDLAVMREAGRRFMDRLAAGDPPDLDSHTATAAVLKRLHPSVEDIDIEVPIGFAEGYRRARALRSRADALVGRYEARARQLLGNGRRLVCGGRLVVSRSVYDQATDQAELTALDTDRPVVDRLNPGRTKKYD